MKKLTQNQEIKRLNSEEGYVEFLAEHCVVENAREIKIHTVAGMCDNKHLMTLKKNIDGDFKLNTHAHAYLVLLPLRITFYLLPQRASLPPTFSFWVPS